MVELNLMLGNHVTSFRGDPDKSSGRCFAIYTLIELYNSALCRSQGHKRRRPWIDSKKAGLKCDGCLMYGRSAANLGAERLSHAGLLLRDSRAVLPHERRTE